MPDPVRSHLLIQNGVAGIGGVFEDEKKPEAESGGKRDKGVRENSLHQRNASYNRADGTRQAESARPDAQVPATLP